MTVNAKRHIDFDEWEPGHPLDRAHLDQCPDCRRQWRLAQFLNHMATASPKIEPPPFFAARVAQLAVGSTSTYWGLLEAAARRLIPVLAMIVLVISGSLYYLAVSSSDAYDLAQVQLLLPPAEEDAEVTLDEFVYSLSREEGTGEER